MASGTKRLDLQFGSFACSVQGFDDPVEPVQQVLRAMQHLLEESPDLGTAGITFEAETLEQLVEEVSRRADLADGQVEIVPGLVIVHHGGLQGDQGDGPFADEEAETPPQDAGYVNIFAPTASEGADFDDPAADYPDDRASGAPLNSSDAADAADFAPALATDMGNDDGAFEPDEGGEGLDHSDLISNRLGQLRDDPPAQDIFAADAAGADAGSNVFADPGSALGSPLGSAPSDSQPINFFSDPLTPGQSSSDNGASTGNGAEEAPLQLFTSNRAATSGAGAQNGAPDASPDVTEVTGEDDEANGFSAARLAASADAASVADLMASAAAWMVLIKGQTTFSRKDVIGVFESIPGEHDNSLQARIKGFGKAVRNGQLVMVEDGVFGLSRSELERFQRVL